MHDTEPGGMKEKVFLCFSVLKAKPFTLSENKILSWLNAGKMNWLENWCVDPHKEILVIIVVERRATLLWCPELKKKTCSEPFRTFTV